jgi:hypothetical protein
MSRDRTPACSLAGEHVLHHIEGGSLALAVLAGAVGRHAAVTNDLSSAPSAILESRWATLSAGVHPTRLPVSAALEQLDAGTRLGRHERRAPRGGGGGQVRHRVRPQPGAASQRLGEVDSGWRLRTETGLRPLVDRVCRPRPQRSPTPPWRAHSVPNRPGRHRSPGAPVARKRLYSVIRNPRATRRVPSHARGRWFETSRAHDQPVD